jgi:hypothetical protein
MTEADLDLITDVLSELSVTDGLNLIWALAKNADKELSEPGVWYHEFSQFPLDDVLTELVPALVSSCISTKNTRRCLRNSKRKRRRQSRSRKHPHRRPDAWASDGRYEKHDPWNAGRLHHRME